VAQIAVSVRGGRAIGFVELPPNCKTCGHDHWVYSAPNGITYCRVIGCHCLEGNSKRAIEEAKKKGPIFEY
jgi:hypothetical protein